MTSSRARLILELARERGLLDDVPPSELEQPEELLQRLLGEGVLSDATVAEIAGQVEAGEDSPTLADTPESVRRELAAGGVALLAEDAFLAGWDRYQIQGVLGSGGMGRVYKAWDPRLERHVALKFIRSADPVLARRFEREARLQARLEHEHVCQVYEVGEVEGRLYIAMQLLKGTSLAVAHHRMALRDRVQVAQMVALALHEAHQRGLVHRDIKPANIMVREEEDGSWQPSILDFGLARDQVSGEITQEGMLVGTPRYMSPEQARDLALDHRTDIFSLGASLYEMLGGVPPFGKVASVAALISLLERDPEPLRQLAPEVPRDLEAVVMKCLEREPARRYATARDLADDLGRFLAGETVRARPLGPLRRGWRTLRRYPLVSVAVAGAVLAVVLWQFTAWQARRDAALVHRITRKVETVEGQLHTARLAPLHDLGPELELARAELAGAEGELVGARRHAVAPGHLALARGYSSLGDLDRALEYARSAWDMGLRDPDAAFTYGSILGAVYQREHRTANRIPDRELARARQEELDRTLRPQALELLRQGRAARSASPRLAEALIALYDRDFATALERAKEAEAGFRWPHESWRLQGEIHFAQALELARAGELAAAESELASAFELFQRALEVARSDGLAYTGMCVARSERVSLQLEQGQDPVQAVEETMAACALAAEANPAEPEPMAARSMACFVYARYLLQHGRDPGPWLDQGEEHARAAIAADPEDAEGHLRLGYVYLAREMLQVMRAEDPEPAGETALESFGQALAIEPRDLAALNATGIAHRYVARWQRVQGIDPRPRLRQAVEVLERALEVDPKMVPALASLGTAWWEIGSDDMERGDDHRPSFARALEACARAAELSPGHATIQANLCGIAQQVAEDRLKAEGEASDSMGQAMAACQRSVELNPTSYLAWHNLGLAHQLEAVLANASGGAAEQGLVRAEAALTKALELNPASGESALELVAVALTRCWLALADGRADEASVGDARRALARSRGGPVDQDFSNQLEAGVELAAAATAAVGGGDPGPRLEAVERLVGGPEAAERTSRAALLAHARLLGAWSVRSHGGQVAAPLAAVDPLLEHLPDDVERRFLSAWRTCLADGAACAELRILLARPWVAARYGYVGRLPEAARGGR